MLDYLSANNESIYQVGHMPDICPCPKIQTESCRLCARYLIWARLMASGPFVFSLIPEHVLIPRQSHERLQW